MKSKRKKSYSIFEVKIDNIGNVTLHEPKSPYRSPKTSGFNTIKEAEEALSIVNLNNSYAGELIGENLTIIPIYTR